MGYLIDWYENMVSYWKYEAGLTKGGLSESGKEAAC